MDLSTSVCPLEMRHDDDFDSPCRVQTAEDIFTGRTSEICLPSCRLVLPLQIDRDLKLISKREKKRWGVFRAAAFDKDIIKQCPCSRFGPLRRTSTVNGGNDLPLTYVSFSYGSNRILSSSCGRRHVGIWPCGVALCFDPVRSHSCLCHWEGYPTFTMLRSSTSRKHSLGATETLLRLTCVAQLRIRASAGCKRRWRKISGYPSPVCELRPSKANSNHHGLPPHRSQRQKDIYQFG